MYKTCPTQECKESIVVPNYPKFDDQITNCRSTIVYGASIQPSKENDERKYYNNIGPTLQTQQYTKTPQGYVNKNPLTFDSMRSQRMAFARPHLATNIDIHNTDPVSIVGYKIGCCSYDELQGGNQAFYTTDQLRDVYKEPVFNKPHLVQHSVYQSPMGTKYPTYTYVPNEEPFKCGKELSFIHDTNANRNFFMAHQMSRINRTDYNAYHA